MKRLALLALVVLLAACSADPPFEHTARVLSAPANLTDVDVAHPATTTTTAPRRSTPQRASRGAPRSRPRAAAPPTVAAVGGDIWRRLANCEAADGRDSAGGRYHGYFQFTLSSWQRVGMSGDPHTYPYDVQRAAAQRLQALAGWGQWPVCARRLGLIP